MGIQFVNGNVRAICPDCGGAVSTFHFQDASHAYGSVVQGAGFPRKIFTLMSCGGCGRGALATVEDKVGQYSSGRLIEFYPTSIERASLPPGVPPGVTTEFREAELCASVRAWRGASALLRSVLEKTLIENGYTKGSLKDRIDEAAKDGVITAARQKRAHDDVRVLGNDVLHDQWREVTEDEYAAAHLYAQRILEDLYDSRAEVEQILRQTGRLATP